MAPKKRKLDQQNAPSDDLSNMLSQLMAKQLGDLAAQVEHHVTQVEQRVTTTLQQQLLLPPPPPPPTAADVAADQEEHARQLDAKDARIQELEAHVQFLETHIKELEDDVLPDLNRRLDVLQDCINLHPEVRLEYVEMLERLKKEEEATDAAEAASAN